MSKKLSAADVKSIGCAYMFLYYSVMSSHGFLNNIAHISTLYTYFPLETSKLFPSGSVMTALVLNGTLIERTKTPFSKFQLILIVPLESFLEHETFVSPPPGRGAILNLL